MMRRLKFPTFSALALAAISILLPITARPALAVTETVLYNFIGGIYGGLPTAHLTSDGAGNFYGTTWAGGSFSGGTVFELSPNGNSWNEKVLYNFCSAPNCSDGANPRSYVIIDKTGNIYGTTYYGGAPGCFGTCGVVFELSPEGGNWTESVLYTFPTGGVEGFSPTNGLIMDQTGNLYGTTRCGGGGPEASGCGVGAGTVFQLSFSGGTWTHQIIYAPGSSTGDGIWAGLTMDSAGNIFGATDSAAFELSPDGKGGWTPKVLHTFAGSPKDGLNADGTPVLDKAGNIYGTTETGGARNYGTVYRLTPVLTGKKKGTWTEKILYSFKGSKRDGKYPLDGISFDSAGNIYGTTYLDGKGGNGIVFELVAPVGKASYKEKVLWIFNTTDGEFPYGGVILDDADNLYGTTYQGGANGAGVVFELTP